MAYLEHRVDLTHDHLTFGFRRGCVACAQVEADLACARRSLEQLTVVATPDRPG